MVNSAVVTSIRFCVHAEDFAQPEFCGPNITDTCVSFFIEYSPPLVSLIYPPVTNVSCTDIDGQSVRILLSDGNGIDESSIVVMVNGERLTTSDPRLYLASDTLIFRPLTPFPTGYVLNLTLLEVSDILGNPGESVSIRIIYDLEPPSCSLISPIGITALRTPLNTINMFDLRSPFENRMWINGEPRTFDALVSDTGRYTPVIPFSEEDSVRICLSMWDLTGPCPENRDSVCFGFLVDALPPAVTLIRPLDWEMVSCVTETVKILTSDYSGVNPTSIRLAVNGTVYSFGTSLRFINDTIIFIPPVPWESGDTVVIDLVNISDMAGNSTSRDGILHFVVDTEAPLVSVTPIPPDTFYTSRPRFALIAEDDPAGVDMENSSITIGGITTTLSSLSASGDSLIIDCEALGISFSAGDSIVLCLEVLDLAKYCGANTLDSCLTYYMANTPPVITGWFPAESLIISCRDTGIIIFVEDDEGLDSAVISVNGVEYSSLSAFLSITADGLLFTPSSPLNGRVDVCVLYLADVIVRLPKDYHCAVIST